MSSDAFVIQFLFFDAISVCFLSFVDHLHIMVYYSFSVFFFFFQAEDGIRDKLVTGVQTCALPISDPGAGRSGPRQAPGRLPARPRRRSGRGCAPGRRADEETDAPDVTAPRTRVEIGRASCRERV